MITIREHLQQQIDGLRDAIRVACKRIEAIETRLDLVEDDGSSELNEPMPEAPAQPALPAQPMPTAKERLADYIREAMAEQREGPARGLSRPPRKEAGDQ
jgi:hypothetical protein